MVDPEVDGRDGGPEGDRDGAVPMLGNAAKGDTGERGCGEGDERGNSWFWLEKASGERVGGVNIENEPDLSLGISEAPEDRLLDVLGKGC